MAGRRREFCQSSGPCLLSLYDPPPRAESRPAPTLAGWYTVSRPISTARGCLHLSPSVSLAYSLGRRNGVAHATLDKPAERTMLIGKRALSRVQSARFGSFSYSSLVSLSSESWKACAAFSVYGFAQTRSEILIKITVRAHALRRNIANVTKSTNVYPIP